ncbi:MAG: bifunctional folylpolyglutamate synthase/dihydrofolate synthase, partial [Candidatus Ratteibacteria bacterium]
MSNIGHIYLEQLTDFGIKLGLDKIKFLLSKLGNPHKKYRSVLIAGTNGKGSVASFIASCLKEAGYRVGFYTSPHLIRVEERIQINGKPIPSKVFDGLCLELKNLCMKLPIEMQPTYFEALTAVAFEYFKMENINICVCEVGMGGRFDATNVLEPNIEVITPISYDHMEYLGNSIEEIAEKTLGTMLVLG